MKNKFTILFLLFGLGCAASVVEPNEPIEYNNRQQEICDELESEYWYFLRMRYHPNITERQKRYLNKFLDQYEKLCFEKEEL